MIKKSTIILSVLAALFVASYYLWQGKGENLEARTSIRLIGEALPPLEALETLSAKFTKETGINVIVEQYAVNEVHQKIMTDLVSSSGTYDLILQPHKHLGRLVSNNYLKPLGGCPDLGSDLNLDFDPNVDLFSEWWNEISCYKGKAYGFPFSALTMYLWYRRDLFENPAMQKSFEKEYGYPLTVPKYWGQYTDVAEFFTRPGDGFYGTAIQGKRHDALWYEFLNYLYSFGGDILEIKHGWEYGPIVINSPEAIDALKYYKSLMKHSPPGTLNYTWDDALAVMQQGKVAMVIMWNDSTYAVEYSKDSTVAGKMGFAMIPMRKGKDRRVGQLEGWSYLIPHSSPKPDEALQFITWMMKEGNQIEQHLNGGASARRSTYEDPRVAQLTYTEASLDTMEVALPKPTIPEGPEMTEILTRELSAALAGEKSPKEALDTAALGIKKLLGDKTVMKYPVN
uniref:Carbohydrate ABC transporter substrate-binding protein, CUT1 family n=1 Tax=Candidatus Kentrum sp. DK TaxID=2126562 RepID=A0A450SN62_9GAMM|nr:MAG: carbohydrate ABC transporter substrate-binding protein, CUT1 family [Candidatus Kentron sp. DK]